MNLFKKTVMTLACLALFAIGADASAKAVYLAQNATGAANGADCADAEPVSFFNTQGNWGSGIAQIGPGTTVYLCGTFTGTAGSTILKFQGSGGSGNVITLLFTPGAVLQAPYFSQAIHLNGQSHILINGGTNGLIQNTQNGTNLMYQQPGSGIYSGYSGSNVEIENLTISPIYQMSGADTANEGAWENTDCIFIDEGYDNVRIHNNNMSYCRTGIFDVYTTMTSGQYYNNTIDYSSWMLIVGDGNNNSSASGVLIYGNTLGPHFQAFLPADQSVHGDGIFVFATNGGSSFTGQIYNNYVHGDMCTSGIGNCTAYLFIGSGVNNTYVFNNIFSQDVGGGPEADIVIRGGIQSPTNIHVLNNTIAGLTNGIKTDEGGCCGGAGTGMDFRNNIFDVAGIGILSGPANFNQIATSNYNDFYGTQNVAANQASTGPGNYFTTLASFQATTIAGGAHPDLSSSGGNPLLGASYVSQPNSSASCTGTNLYGLITNLNFDKAGTARPNNSTIMCANGSNNWTMGAMQSSGNAPTPPSGLSAVVQ
jgi:hypothetical protein